MTCPHWESTATIERPDRTELGYRRFRCRDCQRGFNERGRPIIGCNMGVFAYPLEKVYSHGPEWMCLWAELSYHL
jgi:hypothetical protein